MNWPNTPDTSSEKSTQARNSLPAVKANDGMTWCSPDEDGTAAYGGDQFTPSVEVEIMMRPAPGRVAGAILEAATIRPRQVRTPAGIRRHRGKRGRPERIGGRPLFEGTDFGNDLWNRPRAAAVGRHGGEDGMGSGRCVGFDAPPCGEDFLRRVGGNLGNRGAVRRFRNRTELLGCAEGRAAVRGLRVHQVGLRLFRVQEDRIHDVDDAGGHFLRDKILRRPPGPALRQPVG